MDIKIGVKVDAVEERESKAGKPYVMAVLSWMGGKAAFFVPDNLWDVVVEGRQGEAHIVVQGNRLLQAEVKLVGFKF